MLFLVGGGAGLCVQIPENQLFLGAVVLMGALLTLLTSVSVSGFLSLDTEISKRLREKGFYEILMRYGRTSLLLSLLLVLMATGGFLIHKEISVKITTTYTIILFGFLLSACGAFYRIFSLLTRIGGFHAPNKNDR